MSDKTCLVTKYKKVVNNNNLKKRGVLVVHMSHLDSITNEGQYLMQLRSQVPSTVTVLGGGYVTEDINHHAQEDIRTEGTKQIELQANRLTTLWFYNSPEPYDVEITNKYDLDFIQRGTGSISMPYVDLEDLRYLTNLKTIGFGSTATFGPFDALSNLKDLEYLALDQGTGNIYGDIDILSRMTNLWGLYLPPYVTGSLQSISNILPNLVRFSCSGGNLITGNTSAFRSNSVLISCYLNSMITGNLSDFSGCSSTLEGFGFPGATGGDLGTDFGSHIKLKTLYLSAAGRLTGSIEDFVSRQKTAGRTSTYTPSDPSSTAIVGSFLTSGFTFGGNVIECPLGYYISWLAWEGNKIIIYQGNNTDFSSYAYVYAKGATSAEITAWRNAGKTVTVIS